MVPKCTGAEVSWAEVSRHRYDSTQYSLAPQFAYCIDDVMLKCAASTGVGIAGVGIAVCSPAGLRWRTFLQQASVQFVNITFLCITPFQNMSSNKV